MKGNRFNYQSYTVKLSVQAINDTRQEIHTIKSHPLKDLILGENTFTPYQTVNIFKAIQLRHLFFILPLLYLITFIGVKKFSKKLLNSRKITTKSSENILQLSMLIITIGPVLLFIFFLGPILLNSGGSIHGFMDLFLYCVIASVLILLLYLASKGNFSDKQKNNDP